MIVVESMVRARSLPPRKPKDSPSELEEERARRLRRRRRRAELKTLLKVSFSSAVVVGFSFRFARRRRDERNPPGAVPLRGNAREQSRQERQRRRTATIVDRPFQGCCSRAGRATVAEHPRRPVSARYGYVLSLLGKLRATPANVFGVLAALPSGTSRATLGRWRTEDRSFLTPLVIIEQLTITLRNCGGS